MAHTRKYKWGMKMENDWRYISKELEGDGVNRPDKIIDALLNEKDKNNVRVYGEKEHWWKFLAEEFSHKSVEELKQGAENIEKVFRDQDQRAVKYCDLLNLENPLIPHIKGPGLYTLRKVEPVFVTWAYEFRWIYIDGESLCLKEHQPGLTLNTIKRYVKLGEIKEENNELFRSAAFTRSVKDGTIEKYSSDRLPVNWP